MTIAMEAGECEVIDRCNPSVLPRDDVINLEGETVMRMRDAAVFAATLSTFPNLMNQFPVH
jgi:hypothetical protein